MVERIRSLFASSQFVASGSLIKLVDNNDYYAKSTLFMNAKITIKNWTVHIQNDDFDPDQEQSEFYSFEIDSEMEISHFTVFDDDNTQIDTVKWKNLNTAIIETASIIGFEFSSPKECQRFLNLMNEMVDIKEEGIKRFEDRPRNLKPTQNKLNVTTQLPTSLNIERAQIMPEPLQKEEEVKIQNYLNFKEKVILQLQNILTPDQIIFCSPGNLYLNSGNNLEQLEEWIGFLVVKHSEAFLYTLDLVRGSNIIMRNIIDKDFVYEIDSRNRRISWIEQLNTIQKHWVGYLLEDISHLETLFLVAQFESSRHESVDYVLSADDKEWLTKQDSSQEEFSEDEQMEIEYRDELKSEEDPECILNSATYYGSPYMFAAKENNIGVYQLGYESLSLQDSISTVYNRKRIQPSQLLFYQQGSRLLMLNNKEKNGIFDLDVNSGKIVQKYSPGESEILSICSPEKLSQTTIDPLFLAMGENSLLTIDTRISGKKQVASSKVYKTNPHLTCLSSTNDGYITVGSKKGEIRMYKQIGENSRTNLPGFGEGITSIDVTKDGSWILATTEKFLIAAPTKTNEGELGFLKKIGKKIQKPRKLVLKPEDIYNYQLTNYKFTAARFDISERNEESFIITSRGKFLIIWNFNSVKRGKLDNYKIKEMQEEPIKNEFKFNEKNSWTTHLRALRFQRNNFGFE